MKKLLKWLLEHLDRLLKPVREKLEKWNKEFDKYFNLSWIISSLQAKIGWFIGGIVAILGGISSLIFTILNVDTLVDLISGTVKGQSFWLEKLENVIKGYPSFQSLVSQMDAQLSSLGTYFTPPLTFTRILTMFGIGDAVNTIIVCAVQGVAFVISMRILFWGLGRVKIRMVKPVK